VLPCPCRENSSVYKLLADERSMSQTKSRGGLICDDADILWDRQGEPGCSKLTEGGLLRILEVKKASEDKTRDLRKNNGGVETKI